MAKQLNAIRRSGREAALARRQSLSARGKAAVGTSSNRVGNELPVDTRQASQVRRAELSRSGKGTMSPADQTPSASIEQEHSLVSSVNASCGCGCNDEKVSVRHELMPQFSLPQKTAAARQPRRKALNMTPARAAVLARRQALKVRGKSGLSSQSASPAQAVRVANPELSSRELAQAIREQRSRTGSPGRTSSGPCGRTRPVGKKTTPISEQSSTSEPGHGEVQTGMRNRPEPALKSDASGTSRYVTGNQYLGADIFHEFSQSEAARTPLLNVRTPKGAGQVVTGTAVGRAKVLTGNEPGTCQRVTGTEYLPADHDKVWCKDHENRASGLFGTSPPLMERDEGGSRTLQGARISGSLLGRGTRVTGSETGGCSHVTGDDYAAAEDYANFCKSAPVSHERKVHVSQTLKGERITGTLSDRTRRVTGNEPGSCKAITGTPYAGAETYQEFCEVDDTQAAISRQARRLATPGIDISGIQPGLGGPIRAEMAGQCQAPTGTPYIGTAQYAAACPAMSESPDYPQPLSFPVNTHLASAKGKQVTGFHGGSDQITGPFTMAAGKVTGTEEFISSRGTSAKYAKVRSEKTEESRTLVTGEGMAPRTPITGDDWDRGDRVTGTEGTSAIRRNPTRRGPIISAIAQTVDAKRNEDLAKPISKVTGGSGNTDKGAVVTYSGGARG